MAVPSNIEIEQLLLGQAMLRSEDVHLMSMLNLEDFASAEHRVIFETIALMISEGRIVTPFSLIANLPEIKIPNLSLRDYIFRLVSHASQNMTDGLALVGELKQLSARRSLVELSSAMADFGRGSQHSMAEFVCYAVEQLDGIASSLRPHRKTMRHVEVPLGERLEKMENGEVPDSIHTGLVGLNRIMGGWHRGELGVIAARPSMGKTALALSSLRQAAARGTSSIFFSMEISADQVACRLASDFVWNSQTPVPYENIDQHRVDRHDLNRLKEAREEIALLPMLIDDQRGLTVGEIGARVRKVKSQYERMGKRLDVVCIDHLGKIAASTRYSGNKVHETGEKTNALAQMAMELDVSVIVLQQLNRGPEGREDKRPGLADLRDSGNIEEDADTVTFVFREAYYLEKTKYNDSEKEEKRLSLLDRKKNTLELIVSKNRRGRTCNKEFFVDIGSNAVRDSL